MNHCNTGEKAIVNYAFDQANKGRFETTNTPIIIEINTGIAGTTATTKCWKFIGKGELNDNDYEFFFCGKTASSDGTNCIVDGVNKQRLRPGTCALVGSVGTPIQRDPAKVAIDTSRGECNCACEIRIKHESLTLHSQTGDCPITYTVDCGNCPDGYLKLKTDSYPGYCCLPCKQTAQQIQNIANKIKD